MVVLSKPVGVSFDLNPQKAQTFLKKSPKSACEKAIERASMHRKKTPELTMGALNCIA